MLGKRTVHVPAMRVLLLLALLASGCLAQESSIDLNVYDIQWGTYRPTKDSLLVYVDYKIGAEEYEGLDHEEAVGLNFYIKNRDQQKQTYYTDYIRLPHSLADLRNASGFVSTFIRDANVIQPGDIICSNLESRAPVTVTLDGGTDFEECHPLSSYVEVTEFTPIIRPHIGTDTNFAFMSYELTFGEDTEQVTGQDMYNIKTFLSGSSDGTEDQHILATHVPQIGPSPVIEAGRKLSEQLVQTISKANTETHRYICFTLEPRHDISFNYNGKLTYCESFPTDNTTCRLWGDPHQKTFDGYGYTFQGECEYVAVETCKNEDGDVEDFRVIVDNFRRRPSRQITFIRELRLEFNGVAYALIHPNEVTVDGVSVTLPYKDSANGVSIHYAAPNKILNADFGLTIRLDDEHNGDITLSDYYKNKVCGLCGNFDEDRRNECHYRNGTNMNERNVNCTEKHTKEWFVNGSCHRNPPKPPTIPPEPKPCDKEEVRRQVQELCSLLTDSTGPFAACHDFVSPELYAATCEYDGCELFPETEFPCKSMEMYYYDCQSIKDWTLDDLLMWRSKVEQCPPVCPDGMFYNPSGDGCPPSCPYPNGYEGPCPFPRAERCECPYDMVFDGVNCVSPNMCGCLLENGIYLSKGDVYVSEDCTTTIECIRPNRTRLTQGAECVEHAECTTKNGRRDCYCVKGYEGDGRQDCNIGRKSCHIYGDPHFDTFDNWHYSFQGDCTYIATRMCEDPPDGFPPFEVHVETGKLVPTERFTWMTAIILLYEGKTYKMSHTGAITVDNVDYRDSLPFEDEGVEIFREGDGLVLETEFGLRIPYDGENDANIDLPAAYQGKVCGLCANADNDDKNEKVKPDGTQVKNKLDFANSWGASEDCPPVLKPVHTCVEGTPEETIALDSCGILLQKDGPLASCYDYREPQDYYNSCLFDLCGTLPSMEQLCKNVEQYVLACRSNGGSPSIDWQRYVPACKPVKCPEGYTVFQRSCYKYFPVPKNFESAKAHCLSQCAHLVTITTTGENQFVGGFAENKTSWIGAERNFENPVLELESSGEDVNTFLPIRLPKDFGSFKFSVQTEGDAHLILSSFPEIVGEDPVYDILLGGTGNPTNSLSRCLVCEPEGEAPRSYVRGDQETIFYVTIKGSVIEIGRNYQSSILEVDEEKRIMDIRHVAFRTDGAPGIWKFYTSEFDWITEESWTGFNGYRMGEPSNFRNQEHCLETNFNGEPGVWNDKNCNRPTAYVCEIDPDTE
ncbi:IgGFc-binding protein [Holothuria leucospilota]|uniref:IgGFc-binding protein n=1 Tax=Holothuria leucospilota TaxID=206669 RepID=A0A9Q1CCE8_HOLLE|nr:IgGFc-binding protein [Holothuria leucospilota]